MNFILNRQSESFITIVLFLKQFIADILHLIQKCSLILNKGLKEPKFWVQIRPLLCLFKLSFARLDNLFLIV